MGESSWHSVRKGTRNYTIEQCGVPRTKSESYIFFPVWFATSKIDFRIASGGEPGVSSRLRYLSHLEVSPFFPVCLYLYMYMYISSPALVKDVPESAVERLLPAQI